VENLKYFQSFCHQVEEECLGAFSIESVGNHSFALVTFDESLEETSFVLPTEIDELLQIRHWFRLFREHSSMSPHWWGWAGVEDVLKRTICKNYQTWDMNIPDDKGVILKDWMRNPEYQGVFFLSDIAIHYKVSNAVLIANTGEFVSDLLVVSNEAQPSTVNELGGESIFDYIRFS
jgi:hypothetical protein